MLSSVDLLKLVVCSTKLFELDTSQCQKFLLRIPEDKDLYAKVHIIALNRNLKIDALDIIGKWSVECPFDKYCDKYINDLKINGQVDFAVALDCVRFHGFGVGNVAFLIFVNNNSLWLYLV